MLSIDKGSNAARLLCLGNSVNGQCGLTRTLGAINLNDTTFGVSAYAQSGVEGDTACRYYLYVFNMLVAKLHDRPLTKVFLYLCHGRLQSLQFAFLHQRHVFVFLCHIVRSPLLFI